MKPLHLCSHISYLDNYHCKNCGNNNPNQKKAWPRQEDCTKAPNGRALCPTCGLPVTTQPRGRIAKEKLWQARIERQYEIMVNLFG